MQSGGCSERNQNNNLKAIIAFGKFIGPDTSFYDIHSREQILRYLDTKIKNSDEDPEEKWITTWNDYLNSYVTDCITPICKMSVILLP